MNLSFSLSDPILFPVFRHGFYVQNPCSYCARACSCLSGVAWCFLTSACYCFSKRTEFCLFLICNAFSMFDWLWPSLRHCEETRRAKIFLSPCCDYPMVTLPSSLFCTCLPNVLLTFLAVPVLLSNLLTAPFLPLSYAFFQAAPYAWTSLQSWFLKTTFSSNPPLPEFFSLISSSLPNLLSPSYCSLHNHPSLKLIKSPFSTVWAMKTCKYHAALQTY